MLNLIKTELFKLRHQKVIFVLLLCVIAISSFSAFSAIHLIATPDNPINGKMSYANAFQDIFMLFVIAMFAGFYIGSDFTNRTIQAQLSRGHRRIDIIAAKAIIYCSISSLLLLLYPITVCIIHTAVFGWGELFGLHSIIYLLRTALLGILLDIGTSSIFVCIAFICRDIPKTICCCLAFPVVFSLLKGMFSSLPVIGKLFDFSTLSQLKYIVCDHLTISNIVPCILSAIVTIFLSLLLGNYFFSIAEIK